jgi:hypothetical protein
MAQHVREVERGQIPNGAVIHLERICEATTKTTALVLAEIHTQTDPTRNQVLDNKNHADMTTALQLQLNHVGSAVNAFATPRNLFLKAGTDWKHHSYLRCRRAR